MATLIPNILKEVYQSGQILQAADFQTEQTFHIQHREFQTQQLLTPGILIGLEVTKTANTLDIAAGAAVDENGQQLLLTAAKKLDVKEADGAYLLMLSDAMTAVAEKSNQLKSDPSLKLTLSTDSMTTGVLLAEITIFQGLTTITKAGPPAKILASRLPQPPKTELDASDIRSGVFQAEQIPELQKLKGKISSEQLPADWEKPNDPLIFYAEKTVVIPGTAVPFSWKIDPSVDSLILEYFSDVEIVKQEQKRDGTLLQSELNLQPNQTTTYTLTARKMGVIVAQKQLTITVVTIKELAERFYHQKKTAKDCVEQLKKQFSAGNPYDSALALAKAGYPLTETGAAIKNGYSPMNATEFGKVMAYAYPSV